MMLIYEKNRIYTTKYGMVGLHECSAKIHLMVTYQWEDLEYLSLDITTAKEDFILKSEMAHDDLQIQITGEDGITYYMGTVDVPAGTYIISVPHLPNGTYQIILTTKENHTYAAVFIKQ